MKNKLPMKVAPRAEAANNEDKILTVVVCLVALACAFVISGRILGW